MANTFRRSSVFIPPYRQDEPLFESHRLELHTIPIPQPSTNGYKVLSGGKGSHISDGFSLFKPEKDDFKTVAKGLKFLKFSEDDQKSLYNAIGTCINIATSIVSIIGVAKTVADLAKELGLFGPDDKSVEDRLKELGARMEQVYLYLAGENRRGLYEKATEWRSFRTVNGQGRWNVRISRSEAVLNDLIGRIRDLDRQIGQMLTVNSGNIPFQRSVYREQGSPYDPYWIQIAANPLLGFANGAAMPSYRDSNTDLSSDIWDAGYYIEELVSSLRERVFASASLEPAFRSTGYCREFFSNTAKALAEFIARWRSALIVANPARSINITDGGLPFDGLVVGATDPVTGISSIKVWDEFAIKYSTEKFMGIDLSHEAWAIDPAGALSAGITEHARLVDQVISSSGMNRLQKLQTQFANLAEPVHESEFVQLPVPAFHFKGGDALLTSGRPILLSELLVGEVETTTIDLGELKKYSSKPDKAYVAKRHFREMEKVFRFRMARRTEITRTQLGYRLRIHDLDIELCPFSRRPAEGVASVPFPVGPINTPATSLRLPIYNCCQVDHYSVSKEDKWEKDGAPDRLLVLRGTGKAQVEVSVEFVPLLDGLDDAHAGEAIVTIRNLKPREFPDAYELNVRVYETVDTTPTGDGAGNEKEEFEADSMSITMTPSYLIVSQDFIDDYWQAWRNMVKATVASKLRVEVPQMEIERPIPMEDPNWKYRNVASLVQRDIQEAAKVNPREMTRQINYTRPPIVDM